MCFEDGRNKRTDKPAAALQTIELPDEDFLGPWRAEALEYWGYWGEATQLPQGFADGYLQPETFLPRDNGLGDDHSVGCVSKPAVLFSGYDGDPVLIWHPQSPIDWYGVIKALPDSREKTNLKYQNLDIELRVADGGHGAARFDYFSGGHRWKSKAIPRSHSSARRPVGVNSLYFCGPVINTGSELRPRFRPRPVGTLRRTIVDKEKHEEREDALVEVDVRFERWMDRKDSIFAL